MRKRNQNRSKSKSTSTIEPLETRRLMSTVVVNTTADSTDAKGSSTVSLRDAIAIANAATSATTITFSPTVFNTAKTITLTQGTRLELSKATTITGPSAGVTISGDALTRIFFVDSGAVVSIASVTVTDGHANNNTGDGGGIYVQAGGTLTLTNATVSKSTGASGGVGGGIANYGTTTLNNVTVSGNTSSQQGGGIYSAGTLTFTGGTASGNSAGQGGGGIYNYYGKATLLNMSITDNSALGYGGGFQNYISQATLTNVLINGNSAKSPGGGIGSDAGYSGGSGGPSTLVLHDVTVANNTATGQYGGGIYLDSGNVNSSLIGVTVAGNTGGTGGGIYDAAGSGAVIGNTIVATNTASTGRDIYGVVKSLGHNLIATTGSNSGWLSSDILGGSTTPLNAELGSLANNGGPTETILPLAGSPVIDKGSNSLIPSGITTDQRGLPRVVDGTVDIGAVEVQPAIKITAPTSQTALLGTSKSITPGSFTTFGGTATYKDLITWGDGSASTTLSLTAAGTIPATAHAFAKTGTITVTEIITDAKGNTSNTVSFTVAVTAPTSTISGTVFDDTNANGKQDKGEIGLGLWTVYLDINNNGKLDTGDKSTTTDINGNFSFTGLTAGTYYLRIVPVTGDTTTTPSGGLIKVVLTAGEISTGNLFGEN